MHKKNPTWSGHEISRREYADAGAAAGRGDHVVVDGGGGGEWQIGSLASLRLDSGRGVGGGYCAAGDAVDRVAGDVLGDELSWDVAVLDVVVGCCCCCCCW